MGDRTSGARDLVAGARRLAVTVLVIGVFGAVAPEAEAAPAAAALRAARHGNGDGGGGAHQTTGGTNTSNAPAIKSPVRQVATGRRNVNAPAANTATTFAGVQQVSSVSVFTNTLNGNCKRGIKRCVINQTLRSVESRGGG
ncbi:hypothetical protein GCM10010116_51620 [Microbispora rosea subsp. aerata]|nr:hypothetical protein GCM10010116_51620 [Microbispora rosea subsp. aerata]GIH56905.1 hypothetical protein Mro02_38190 [Microbispora rosea subsp. aerata]GLJ82831.1 hypothetical protein GCM10017588_15570 [Microbispora rosea subsp. aerata]